MDSLPAINSSKNLELRDRLYLEAGAMAAAAFSRGRDVPVKVVATLDAIEQGQKVGSAVSPESVADLVWAHHALAVLISPATPSTILLLQVEREKKAQAFLGFLGPIGLVRQLVMAMGISAIVLIISGVMADGVKGYTTSKGLQMLPYLLEYLAAAGVGAGFGCLYKANRYVTDGAFDSMYISSYWIRFFLGLISGSILAIAVHETLLARFQNVLEPEVMRWMLAMLGGFSSELFYTFLNRFVEAFKSLFQGAADEMAKAEVDQAKTRLAGQRVLDQIQLAAGLMRVQQSIGAAANPEEIKQKLNALMNEVLPGQASNG